MKENTYNGWTNYATWRVNLELFDGFNLEEYYQLDLASCDLSCVADDLKNYAEEFMSIDTDTNSLAYSYAMAFLSEVNWYEIAEHLIEEHREAESCE